ncbi:MAG: hypothetical protein IKA63_00760 [Clostridia bacterium]|nr:hypothetical protein [Clostridia bacterium]
MKKVSSVVLSVLLLLSVVCLAGCGASKTSNPLKFGMGVHAYVEKATNADGDTNGVGEAIVTVAAVLLDTDGKIVKCVLDVADNTVNFTSDGKFVETGEFQTKYEKGDAYGMKAYGGATKEWYEQADAFTALVVGKTVDEVKALVATGGKGTDEVINAGCTIEISDFALAVEKAVTNAAESGATKDHTLKLGVVSSQQSSKDATEDAAGMNEVDTTAVAAVLDKDGKVVAMSTDALQAQFAFDAKGATTVEAGAAIATKKDKGANYGMAQYGQDLNGDGTVKEWFEQAQAFNAACVGKTAAEISALAINTGYGAQSLQTVGCTIHVGDMVKAAVKAATIS